MHYSSVAEFSCNFFFFQNKSDFSEIATTVKVQLCTIVCFHLHGAVISRHSKFHLRYLTRVTFAFVSLQRLLDRVDVIMECIFSSLIFLSPLSSTHKTPCSLVSELFTRPRTSRPRMCQCQNKHLVILHNMGPCKNTC